MIWTKKSLWPIPIPLTPHKGPLTMELLILFVILAVLACVVVLLIYVIDRVKLLESRTLTVTSDPSGQEATGDPRFGRLRGMELWNLMCGKPVEGWNAEDASELRPRYAVVLGKHIEQIFQAGQQQERDPGSAASIATLRGQVESYLPANHASKLFELGSQSAQAADSAELRASIDATCDVLCTRTGVAVDTPFSTKLLGPLKEALADQDTPAIDDTAQVPKSNQSTAEPPPGRNPRSQ